MRERCKVERIILTTDGRDGATYAIVVCTDLTIALTRDGEVLEERWEPSQMEQCVDALVAMGGLKINPVH